MTKTEPELNANLAFAVVVLTSYLATFASFRQGQLLDVLLMIVLGTAYILIGIYGYAYCAHSRLGLVRIGYFLVQIPLGGLIVSLGKGAGFNALLLLPLAGQAVTLLDELWTYLINGLIFLIYLVSSGSYAPSWNVVWENMPVFMAGQIFILVFTQSAVSESKARHQVENLVEELQAANHHLREYSLQIEELAVTKERNRLAREIHDGLGHYLTTIHMQIQAADGVMERDAGKARLMLEKARGLTEDALSDVRASVGALRSSTDESLPLPEMIQKLMETCEAMKLLVDFKVLGSPRAVSAQARLTLYRAAQEGINNIGKHAHASQAWFALDYMDPRIIRLVIQDDGIGADMMEGGFGLMGLRERVALLQGEMIIQTAPNEGFRLEIKVPG